MNIIDTAIDAVMDMIDALDLYSPIRRGALGTGNGICCQVAPSAPEAVYMDKNQYIPLDLTINAKHARLEVVSDAINTIHQRLTMYNNYIKNNDWYLVDIQTLTEPQIIGRDNDGCWIMSSALIIKVETRL